jgi:hypothetical protein
MLQGMHVQRGLQRADATCVQDAIDSALAPHSVWWIALWGLSPSLSARERYSVIGDATVLKVPSCMFLFLSFDTTDLHDALLNVPRPFNQLQSIY